MSPPSNRRFDVRRELLARGWRTRTYLLIERGCVVWGPSNTVGDSSMTRRGKNGDTFTVGFPTDVPAHVIVAACEAAAKGEPRAALAPHKAAEETDG